MDYCKSRNSNSTSSQQSSSSSHKSLASSSNNGTSYNLEYCTSSSSLSPFKTNTSLVGGVSCPSSPAKTIVNVGIDDVILSITGSNSNSSASHISASSSCSSRTLIAASNLSSTSSSNMCSSQNTTKRKRRLSASLHVRDPELGFEPSAKRQQRLPSLYQSDTTTVVSSVYPSPVDEILVNEIDTRSSSECLSTATDYEVTHDDIPDSPNSLRNYVVGQLEVEDDDEEEDDQELDDNVDDDDRVDNDNDQITDEDDVDDMISSNTSPSNSSNASTKAAQIKNHTHMHHGERTPGQRLSTSKPQSSAPTTVVSQKHPKVKSFDDYLAAQYDCMTPAADPEPPRQCPLPALSWANAQDVWHLMCKKDEQAACLRNPTMLDHHPGLQPRMRAILLDWLIEVCEVYKLHRETYYLAVDYLDRYLSAQKLVQKTHLQLIGITCLFVAAKVEEIYPPKIGEFAYVTDGACQESDILQHEILLLQALEWNISPVTSIGWLGVYMQLNINSRTPASFQTTVKNKKPNIPATNVEFSSTYSSARTTEVGDAFIYPQFSGLEFVQTAQLLDLCSLDVGVGNFPYSVLAAAAMSHTFNRETALRCSGFEWKIIQPCAKWMQPYFEVISEESPNLHLLEQNEQISTKFGMGHICPNIVTDESHIIQTHTTTMAMFDRACLLQDQYLAIASKIKQQASPATGLICPDGLLTPPASSRKPLGCINEEEENHNLHSVLVSNDARDNRENTSK